MLQIGNGWRSHGGLHLPPALCNHASTKQESGHVEKAAESQGPKSGSLAKCKDSELEGEEQGFQVQEEEQ